MWVCGWQKTPETSEANIIERFIHLNNIWRPYLTNWTCYNKSQRERKKWGLIFALRLWAQWFDREQKQERDQVGSGLTVSALCEGQSLPVGAIGAVVYSGLTGGQLQQLVPLLLPLLLRVHQTRLRRKEGHTHTHTPFNKGVSNVTKACTDVMVFQRKVTESQMGERNSARTFTEQQHKACQSRSQLIMRDVTIPSILQYHLNKLYLNVVVNTWRFKNDRPCGQKV